MIRRFLGSLALVLALALPSLAQTSVWEIDPSHSSAQFAVRHLAVSTVRGEFSKVTGVIRLDETDITRSSVEATIDTASLDTRDEKRDAHLRSADFFDTVKFPTITFRSRRIEQAANGHLLVTGDLTIRGVTREAVLDVDGLAPAVKDPWGNTKSGATATTRINRKDFGVSWNALMDNGGFVVGEDVTITIDVELVRKNASGAAKSE